MGLLDFLLNKEMKKRKIATEIGLKSGLFVMCPVCHDITEAADPSSLRPGTESLVQELIQQGDPRLNLFGRDAKDIIETVAQVSRELPYRCNCHQI